MNWEQIEGRWLETRGAVRIRWGKLTEEDIAVIGGKRDQLIGILQQRYGSTKEEIERQVDDFTRRALSV